MSRIVRSSKFRHVFGEGSKKENCYDNVKANKGAWDSNKAKANNKYVGLIWESRGGGSFAVMNNEKTGKYTSDIPLFNGHKAAVLDIDTSRFNDQLWASVSEDGNGRIWSVPNGGMTASISDPVQTLLGHKRKVGTVDFHPTADNILATSSTDFTVKIWDIESGSCAKTVSGHADIIQSVAWSRNGSQMVTACKDKKVRVFDPRSESVAHEFDGHPGVKGSRAIFIGGGNGVDEKIYAVGFSKSSDRSFSIHDARNPSNPLVKQNIDTSSGILMPFYDFDTQLLFLAGKGDGNIRYYELVNEAPYIHYIADYKSSTPQLGMAMRPKTACDIPSCEIASFLKVTNNCVEPIHFTVPRKSEMFQDDIFPDTAGPEPSLTAAAWLGGENKDPILISLETGFVPREKPEFKPTTTVEVKEEKPKTELEWKQEVEALTKRVAFLEAELVKRDARIKELEH